MSLRDRIAEIPQRFLIAVLAQLLLCFSLITVSSERTKEKEKRSSGAQ